MKPRSKRLLPPIGPASYIQAPILVGDNDLLVGKSLPPSVELTPAGPAFDVVEGENDLLHVLALQHPQVSDTGAVQDRPRAPTEPEQISGVEAECDTVISEGLREKLLLQAADSALIDQVIIAGRLSGKKNPEIAKELGIKTAFVAKRFSRIVSRAQAAQNE